MAKTIAIDELQEIWERITRLHQGQTYGGRHEHEKIEYINHIGSVVFEVMNAVAHTPGMDGDLAVKCALLHDTVEDTHFSIGELEQLYGECVAAGVQALTKNNKLPKDQKMPDSLQRIQQQPKEVWAVKLADRIANLQAPPFYWTNEKKISYREEAQTIYAALKEGNEYLAARLLEKIDVYKQFID